MPTKYRLPKKESEITEATGKRRRYKRRCRAFVELTYDTYDPALSTTELLAYAWSILKQHYKDKYIVRAGYRPPRLRGYSRPIKSHYITLLDTLSYKIILIINIHKGGKSSVYPSLHPVTGAGYVVIGGPEDVDRIAELTDSHLQYIANH